MPWFKLDDGFHSHPKVLEAGNEAVGLFVRCGTYVSQHLTDGFIPQHIALLYGSKRLAQRLVDARLWTPVDGGWVMPDYLDFNPSRDKVKAERESAAERQRRAREKAKESRNRHAVSHAEAPSGVTLPPTRPDPTLAAAAADTAGLAPALDVLRGRMTAHTALAGLRWDTLSDTQAAEIEQLIGIHGDARLVDVALRTCRTPPPTLVSAFIGTWRALPAPGQPHLRVVEHACPDHPHELARNCRACAAERLAGERP